MAKLVERGTVMQSMGYRTRFAPSPTGPLHLGHAFSALTAFDTAKRHKGTFVLRIDDLDQSRSRPEWERLIYKDLEWLGLTWETPVRRQSDALDSYSSAISKLTDMGLTYPCSCSREDVEAAASAPQEGVPAFGPDGRIYPGSCRHMAGKSPTKSDSIRLNMEKAIQHLKSSLVYFERDKQVIVDPKSLITHVGDVILRRKSMGASYHLSVVVDDFEQDVTHVIRGQDLSDATQIHVLLQTLLGYPIPAYHHHELIRDANGKRLAKRDDARSISKYREDGTTVADIRRMVGL